MGLADAESEPRGGGKAPEGEGTREPVNAGFEAVEPRRV